MRTIRVPAAALKRATSGPIQGCCVEVCVDLGWPELRLTEEQIIANALARAYGHEAPYPDKNLVTLRLDYLPSAVEGSCT